MTFIILQFISGNTCPISCLFSRITQGDLARNQGDPNVFGNTTAEPRIYAQIEALLTLHAKEVTD